MKVNNQPNGAWKFTSGAINVVTCGNAATNATNENLARQHFADVFGGTVAGSKKAMWTTKHDVPANDLYEPVIGDAKGQVFGRPDPNDKDINGILWQERWQFLSSTPNSNKIGGTGSPNAQVHD